MSEIWKEIPGHDGAYLVSNMGNIFSKRKNRQLNPSTDSYGYLIISLGIRGRGRKNLKVHRLVMLAFHGPSELEVNHIDCNRKNNKLDNLEYCTMRENRIHAVKYGKFARGEYNNKAKLTWDDVRYIRANRQMSRHHLSKMFGVKPLQINRIWSYRAWKE